MRQKGFTLIELLVVVGLVALVVSFVTPTFQIIISQLQLASASSSLSDYLLLTEQKTVTEQVSYGVTFTVGATTIPRYLYTPGQNGGLATKTPSGSLSLPANIQVDQVNFSNMSDIYFSTSAAPNMSGDLVLLDTSRNRRRRITIGPSGVIETNQAEF